MLATATQHAITLGYMRMLARAPSWTIGLVTWLVLGALLFAVVYRLDGHERHLFEQLRHSRMTAGTLIAKDIQNHDSFTYRYADLSGQRYLGGDGGEGQEQGDPADLSIGAVITIWYDVKRPAVSCYCTPSDNPPGGLIGLELAISQFLAIPVGALIGFATYRRRAGAPPFRLRPHAR